LLVAELVHNALPLSFLVLRPLFLSVFSFSHRRSFDVPYFATEEFVFMENLYGVRRLHHFEAHIPDPLMAFVFLLFFCPDFPRWRLLSAGDPNTNSI